MQARSTTEFNLEEYVPIIKEVIESGGEFRLYPRGTSMLPVLRQGIDSVILVSTEKNLKKRDIIFYKRPDGQFVLHRIVGISNDGTYILCGDNQTVLEKGVEADMIIASVAAVCRGEKRIEKNAFSRRFYELFWCIMPLRKLLLFIKRVLSKIKRTIFR